MEHLFYLKPKLRVMSFA